MDSNDQSQEPQSEPSQSEPSQSESSQSDRPQSDRPQSERGGRGRPRRRGGRGRSQRQREGQRQPQAEGQAQAQAEEQRPDSVEGQRPERAEGQRPERAERQRPEGGERQRDGQRDGQRQGQRQRGQRQQGGRQGQERGRGQGQDRGQGQRQQGQRASKVALIAPATPSAKIWADRIQEYLLKHIRTVTRQDVEGNAGLTERLKEARAHGAHRIVAVGDHQFVRWAAQAMVGSLMPLAPVLLPGSKPIFGYKPLPTSGWEPHVEALLSHKFAKVDMAMGTVNPFVHQLLAGFPAKNGTTNTSTWQAIFNNSALKLKIQVDRTAVEGDFWCLAMANADLPDGSIRWLPGSNWEDQRLDLLLVRPRSMWQKWKFMQALKRGEHGAEPGVMRYRGHRITVHAEVPWRYSADGSQTQEAASPLVVEARPQMLRLVVPEGG